MSCLSPFVNKASITNISELYLLSPNPGQENEIDVEHEFALSDETNSEHFTDVDSGREISRQKNNLCKD
jgi:hypothetical protein